MGYRTVLTDKIPERSSFRIMALLTDEAGGALSGLPTTLEMTLYLKAAPAMIINGRDGQNILNANGVAINANGNLVWTGTPADCVITNANQAEEPRIALIEWTWGVGKRGAHELEFTVVNLQHVS